MQEMMIAIEWSYRLNGIFILVILDQLIYFCFTPGSCMWKRQFQLNFSEFSGTIWRIHFNTVHLFEFRSFDINRSLWCTQKYREWYYHIISSNSSVVFLVQAKGIIFFCWMEIGQKLWFRVHFYDFGMVCKSIRKIKV